MGWVHTHAQTQKFVCWACRMTFAQKKQIKSHSVRQVIEEPIQAHSVKPDETRRRIVDLLGDVPRIELFARRHAPGWDAWGNEIEMEDKL